MSSMISVVPEGSSFLDLVWQQEDACEADTDDRLPQMGEKASQCLEKLGTVLSLLDRTASCFWGCRKGDHVVEYSLGRAVSTARAALRLIRLGFYDEALALVRSIAEIANVFFLFVLDRNALESWRACTEQERRTKYGPVKVRLAIEERGAQVPIDKKRYRLLSEVATHLGPQTRPQAHNLIGIPSTGGRFQEAGLLVALNELVLAVAYVAGFGRLLAGLPKDQSVRIHHSGLALARTIGRATITEIPEHWAEAREKLLKELESASAVLSESDDTAG